MCMLFVAADASWSAVQFMDVLVDRDVAARSCPQLRAAVDECATMRFAINPGRMTDFTTSQVLTAVPSCGCLTCRC